MIQRIQSFYLFLVVLCSALQWYWSCTSTLSHDASLQLLLHKGFLVSVGLALLSLFLFKKRKQQQILNRINLLLEVITLGFFVFFYFILGGTEGWEYYLVLPLINIFLLLLANRGIKKDEELIRSVDRIR